MIIGAVATWARAAEPIAPLGRPDLTGRFLLLSDGSVRAGQDGPRLTEWLQTDGAEARPSDAPPATLAWLAPGARVVEAETTAGLLRMTVRSGADGHGPLGRQSLWLFRAIRIASEAGGPRRARLWVGLQRGGLALRDDLALLDGEDVCLVVSRKPDEVRAAEAETTLAFDLSLPKEGPADLLLAQPAAPMPYRLRDVPDVRNLNPDFRLGDIVAEWEARVLPHRLLLGNAPLTEAFHAATGALLLDAPAPDNPLAVALSLSALARAGLAPQLPRVIETLVAHQAEDGHFAGLADLGSHADRTTALADCALFSDAPERWAQLLWRPLARAAAPLAAASPTADGARVALALSRVADVARLVGEPGRAEELAALAGARGAQAADTPPRSLFEARAQALRLAAAGLRPPEAPDTPSLEETLLSAYVVMQAGEAAARQRAWQAVEEGLEAQPLPGPPLQGGRNDVGAAAALVFLIADSAARAEADAVHVLPALPAGWARDGELARLTGFPSGLGPVRLSAMQAIDGAVTLSLPGTPDAAQRLRVSPPLGTEVSGLRINGKPAPPELISGGPPWSIDPSVASVVMLPKAK